MVEYKMIESLPPWPLDIDLKEHQSIIKDFFWRVTEEMGESFEALMIHNDKDHCFEEISDATHFLAEAFILIGIVPEKTVTETFNNPYFGRKVAPEKMAAYYWNVVYEISLAGNTLKNKPWKQSQVLTDKPKFIEQMNKTFEALIECCAAFGLTAEDFYYLYFKKAAVNQFRIDSKY